LQPLVPDGVDCISLEIHDRVLGCGWLHCCNVYRNTALRDFLERGPSPAYVAKCGDRSHNR
jgi:hypothetical protein